EPFPQNGLAAARTALTIPDGSTRAAFARAIFVAAFAEKADISSDDVITRCLAIASVSAEDMAASAQADLTIMDLRDAVAMAMRLGIFGAPFFVTSDGDLYWGDDRLEAALRHACMQTSPGR
ncbi:MAG: 2-hydroxychromene-2-carboxylate isomerase, partial [Verrucomicrobiae bacterium]|nr:2-hydroxychromene-2-carboxylate isomerase [Verrucomicrobiae bacterium]